MKDYSILGLVHCSRASRSKTAFRASRKHKPHNASGVCAAALTPQSADPHRSANSPEARGLRFRVGSISYSPASVNRRIFLWMGRACAAK